MTVKKSTTNLLPMAVGVVALLFSAALGIYCFILPTWHYSYSQTEGLHLGFIGMAGVLASLAVVWSSWCGGRWSWVGLLLAFTYLGLAVATPYAVATIHTYGLIAFILVWLAGLNLLSYLGRRGSERIE